MSTGTLAVQVAVRIARGTDWSSAIRQVATLNRVPYGRVRFAVQYIANATCDPYLERLGAQYLPR